jgi:carbon monoxide dehydrogenase subunit G
MRIDKEVKVEVSPDLAWEEFLDVADLIGCVPGAQMEALGDGVYRGAIDADLDERQASFRIRGRETGGLAIGGGIVGGRVVPDNGAARVVLSADLEIVGHGTDQRSVEAGANELLNRFAERLSARIVERASHAGEREAEPGPQRAEAGAPKPASAIGRLTPRHGIALGAIALLVALLLALTGRRRSVSVSLRYRW